jgi:integrase
MIAVDTTLALGTYVSIPSHPILQARLSEIERVSPYILTSERGGPYRPTSIANMVCDACTELGFPGHSPHGLRHLAGAELADAGCSMHEIMSILGHLTEREAAGYVKQASRKVMAQSAVDKWANDKSAG